jgi:hypothetical protein
MKKKTIPDELKEDVLRTIERFNLKKSTKTGSSYMARFQGKFLYFWTWMIAAMSDLFVGWNTMEPANLGALPSTNTATTVTTPTKVGFPVLNSPMEQLRAH